MSEFTENPIHVQTGYHDIEGGERVRSSELTSFFGRRAEIDFLLSLVRKGTTLITITGPGGVGKTRLSISLQDDLKRTSLFPDGAYFIPLASIADHELVVPTIARAFGILADDIITPIDRLIEYLQGKSILLILDNFEHLLDAGLDIAKIHRFCPALTLIVTSRRALRLVGEQEFPLSPLPVVRSDGDLTADELEQSPAIALFQARASAQNPRFVLNESNAHAIAQICSRLDGLPLAIELAAARTKLMSPQAILSRLGGRLQLLTSGPRDVPKRQQTLRDTITWSFNLLTPDEQALFRRLCIFPDGATFDAIESISQEFSSTGEIDLLNVTSSLVDHSLVIQEDGPGGDQRFRMLETIREFGMERLQEAGEYDRARDAHARYFTTFVSATTSNQYGPEESANISRIAVELDNVRAALSWLLEDEAFDSPRARLGLKLGGSMVRFWDVRGYLQEENRWLNRALALTSDTPTRDRATALTALGVNAWFAGDLDRALSFQEKALENWRVIGDKGAIVASLWFIGLVAGRRGDIVQLEALSAEASTLVPDIGIVLWQTVPITLLALAAISAGDAASAEAYLNESLAYHSTHGFLWPHAWMLGVTAQVVELQGDIPRALALFQQGLSEFHQHGDIYGVLEGLLVVARFSHSFGRSEIAARLTGHVAQSRAIVGHRVTWLVTTDELALAAEIESALGAEAFAAERAIGRSLKRDDAVALALAVEPASQPISPAERTTTGGFGLSRREEEVLRYLVEGKTNDEIGKALFISSRTAGTHVANILGKLGVHTRSAAVAVAVRHGILPE